MRMLLTRLTMNMRRDEHEKGYTFFWRGKIEDEPREHDIGFAITNN